MGVEVVVTFHNHIPTSDLGTRDELMEKVRSVINSALPLQYQS